MQLKVILMCSARTRKFRHEKLPCITTTVFIRTLLWSTGREMLLAKLVFPEGTGSNFLVLKTLVDRDAVFTSSLLPAEVIVPRPSVEIPRGALCSSGRGNSSSEFGVTNYTNSEICCLFVCLFFRQVHKQAVLV